MASAPVSTYQGVVYPWHCDHMGHMNVTWYAAKFDEATWSLFASFGITASYVREHGCGMAAVEQHTVYEKELRPGEVVFVLSRVLEARPRTMRFVHELMRADGGIRAATSTITGVHLDLTTRRAQAFPAPILTRIERMMTSATDG